VQRPEFSTATVCFREIDQGNHHYGSAGAQPHLAFGRAIAEKLATRAFSSKVGTGLRRENAIEQRDNPHRTT
jgi:hypothetical protein